MNVVTRPRVNTVDLPLGKIGALSYRAQVPFELREQSKDDLIKLNYFDSSPQVVR